MIEATHGPIRCSFRSDRHYSRPWGIHGGGAGQSFRTTIFRADGGIETIPSKQVFVLEKGDRLEIRTGGGGGYGDALKRAMERVHADVKDRKVSVDAARSDYGVVMDPDGADVDVNASLALREAMQLERGPVSWTIDRGDGNRE